MADKKVLFYDTLEAEGIEFDADDNFLVTSGDGGRRRGRTCNLDGCFGVDWSCVIDRWLFGD